MDLELVVRCCRAPCVLVELNGECDITSASQLRARLLGVLAPEPARIVLDLSGLGFLDCAGARTLLALSRRAMLLGGTLALAAPTAPVARLLRLTGFDQSMAVFASTDAALAAVRSGDHPSGPDDRAEARPAAPGGARAGAGCPGRA